MEFGIDLTIPLEFKKVLQTGLSGELLIKVSNNSKRIYFEKGKLIHCESDLFDERLGVILNLIGRISDSQYDNISGLVHSVDNRIGSILLQNSIITEKELEEAIRYRAMRIAVSSFSITSGIAEFREGVKPDNENTKLNIPIEEIIYSGGRRIEPVNYVNRFYHFNSPFIETDPSPFLRLLSENDKKIIEMLIESDEISNSRIISKSGMHNEKYWETLTVLYLLGIVGFSMKKKDKPTEEDILGLINLKKKLDEGLEDSFAILGVKRSDSANSIHQAYISMAKKYDPDRFSSEVSSETRKSAKFVLFKLAEAFRKIKNISENKKDIVLSEKEEVSYERDNKEFESKISETLEYVPDAVNIHSFTKGKELYLENKFDEALVLLKETIKSGNKKYENYLYLGLCETNLPFFTDEAERNLKKAIELEPAKSEPVHALGKLYLKLNKRKHAIKCFERAVKLEPSDKQAAQDLFKIKYPEKKRKKKLFSRK